MEHRDEIILKKVLSEIDIAKHMMNQHSFTEFESNEMLKWAVCMTVTVDFPNLYTEISRICEDANR